MHEGSSEVREGDGPARRNDAMSIAPQESHFRDDMRHEVLPTVTPNDHNSSALHTATEIDYNAYSM